MEKYPNASHQWTEKDTADLSQNLVAFRKRLPKDQRIAFSRVLANARAAIQLIEGAGEPDRSDAPFSHAVAAFREGLPAPQREAFNDIMTLSALGWGLMADRDRAQAAGESGGGLGTVYFYQLLEAAHLAKIGAMLVVAGVLIIEDLVEDDDEPGAPDLSNIPPSPEQV